MNLNDLFNEEKVRLDPKCWTGKKIGNPKTKVKGGVRVNNCVPAESVEETRKGQVPMTLNPGETDNIEPENFAGFRQLPAYKQGQAAQQKAGKQLIQQSPYTFQSDQDWAYRQGAFDAQQAAVSADFAKIKPFTTTEDSLEEVDRRGFLKGLGAAAAAGAAGYQLGKPNLDNSFYKNPKAVFLMGYLHAAKEYMPRDRDTLEINTIIKDYLEYSQGKAGGLSSGSDQFFNDVGAYNRQHRLGKPGYTEVFDDDVDQKKWIQLQGKEALNQLKNLMQQTKESVQQGMDEGEQQKGADYRDPKEVDYDGEYDAMVARVKRLAGLGPMKTVYDPKKRQYRNMPTAQQPKK